MKKLIFVFAATVMCWHAAAFADSPKGMGDGKGTGGMMQSGEMLRQQTMSQEMMRDMTQMMTRMQEMLRDTTRTMEQLHTMDQNRQREMSQIMLQLSEHLRALSQDVASGTMDRDRTHKMDQDLDRIRDMIKDMQHTDK